MHQVTSASHGQPFSNPAHLDSSLFPQLHCQLDFEGVTFAPAYQMMSAHAFGVECLLNQPLGFGLACFVQLLAVMPLAGLRLDII